MSANHREQLQHWIETACVWEATAPKPGNVHPGASFVDLTFHDFVIAARAGAPPLTRAGEMGVGQAVLDAVVATREACRSNVNLGICLLLAPLAAVPMDQALVDGIPRILAELKAQDTRNVYEAIRRAQPGGLGEVPEQDVSTAPTCGLVEAMRLAEDRDRIAWNYTHTFEDVLVTGPAILRRWIKCGLNNREMLIVALALELMVRTPDTLIARKCGIHAAHEASERARTVLETGWPDSPAGARQMQEFDTWLRSDGHQLNPGTTADIIAATLFAALRDHPSIAHVLVSDRP